VSYQYTALPC